MRIHLHIGLESCGAARFQYVLCEKRNQLAAKGVLFPRAPGRKNHTRLFMAVTEPDQPEPLRLNRGFGSVSGQARLRARLIDDLTAEVERAQPRHLVLSAAQLAAGLRHKSELERLRALLLPLSRDICLVAHVDEQARLLTRAYARQIFLGRVGSLGIEQGLATGGEDWRSGCLALWPRTPVEHPARATDFGAIQAPPFWLDFTALQKNWEDVFGLGTLHFRPYDSRRFARRDVTEEVRQVFDIQETIGKVSDIERPFLASDVWLARGRILNVDMIKMMENGRVVPRPLWRRFMREIAVAGAPIDPASLGDISRVFASANAMLLKHHPALSQTDFLLPRAKKPWTEADPGVGFRTSQYLRAFMPRIKQAAQKTADQTHKPAIKARNTATGTSLSSSARALFTPQAIENYDKFKGSAFAPHNLPGRVNETLRGPDFAETTPRPPPKGSSGKVIVGCMKNEAPYILEWVAYHRQIGVDNFIIYTNDCADGTTEILDRLQALGVVQHRNNDVWKGNSPQQHALNMSLKEDLIKNSEWVIHIDVDEFINIRCDNGTLDDFLARVPAATNVAMTWRLFGSSGIKSLSNAPVIAQFNRCAPAFCPKPHTVWGFKTMFRNIGAYEKISCHRPTKLRESFRNQVNWVNGTGQAMGEDVKEGGWRSSKASIGYDLLQLNHYALRSAESFLIKRQRGRALHVDRSIGLNYWVRMDWNDNRDVTIGRNLPRLRGELARLKADPALAVWHEKGLAWHRAKAAELRATPEFDDLYQQTLKVKLNDMERVAYALALDMET